MTRHFLYLAHGWQTMMAVMKAMPDDDDTGFFGWDFVDAYVVRVADVVAAIYLRACFPERPVAVDDTEILESLEIWVEADDRREAEHILADNCRCHHEWFQVFRISFDRDKDHRAFAEAYTEVTGLDNAFMLEEAAHAVTA